MESIEWLSQYHINIKQNGCVVELYARFFASMFFDDGGWDQP